MEELKNIASGLIEATRDAAIACSTLTGRRDKKAADKLAVEAMRAKLNTLSISGRVVIGEGERDKAPMLFIGEELGNGGVEIDIAVDPLEGTNLCADNMPGAITVMAVGPKGTLMHAPDTYMNRIVVGEQVGDKINLDKPVAENIQAISTGYGIDVSEVCVVILERERHTEIVEQILAAGAYVRMITDAEIGPAVASLLGYNGVHALWGIGAAPETTIIAAAVRALGGYMHARFAPQNDEVRERMKEMGFDDLEKLYTAEELAKGDDLLFVATGVTENDLTNSVIKYETGKTHTSSILISSRDGSVEHINHVQ